MLYFKPIFIIIVVIFIIISLYSCDLGARRYADLIREISLEYGVDPAVVLAVSEVESHFDPKAKSSAAYRGIIAGEAKEIAMIIRSMIFSQS